MKGTKFMRFLLIVTLVYGQLVSNVHAISHFHADEQISAHHHSDHVSDVGTLDLTHSTLTEPHHHPHHYADEHDSAENDCAIYHVLLNLNGGFWAIASDPNTPYQHSANSALTTQFIASVKPEYFSIRAPPATPEPTS